MSTTIIEPAQTNGDSKTYNLESSKFLPKVSSIPVISSFKKQLFLHVPQAELLSKYVYNGVNTVFTYTHDTPIEPMLIKLDTLAANGVSKLEKEVPIVAAPTDEVLKKTYLSEAFNFVTYWYTSTLSYFTNMFDAYQPVLDSFLKPFLDKAEGFLGTQAPKDEPQIARLKRLFGTVTERIDTKVSPIISSVKTRATSYYNDKVLPTAQLPLKQYNMAKEKAMTTASAYTSFVNDRFSKAELSAKDAWTKTKPDISGPNSVVPALKSGLFSGLTFVYALRYGTVTKPNKPSVDDQTNGLVSGVELNDGIATKRPNGVAF